MKRNFTDDDIIRFLYDEMSQTDNEAFLDALCTDEQLWERYEYFQEVVEKVSEVRFEPSELSCKKILAFAHSHHPEPVTSNEASNPAIPKTKQVSILSGLLSVSVNLNAVIVMALLFFISIAVTGTFLKLQRGAINNPDTESLVHQINLDEEQIFKWDDSELDAELEIIREGLEDLGGEPIL